MYTTNQSYTIIIYYNTRMVCGTTNKRASFLISTAWVANFRTSTFSKCASVTSFAWGRLIGKGSEERGKSKEMWMLNENTHTLEGQSRLHGSTDLHGKTMQQEAQNNGHLHDADICRQQYRCETWKRSSRLLQSHESWISFIEDYSVHLTTEGPASVELIQFFW